MIARSEPEPPQQPGEPAGKTVELAIGHRLAGCGHDCCGAVRRALRYHLRVHDRTPASAEAQFDAAISLSRFLSILPPYARRGRFCKFCKLDILNNLA